MVRIGIGYLLQETNTFSPVRTSLADFSLCRGEEVLSRWRGTRTEIGAFLDAAAGAGWTPVPLFAGWAITAGPLYQTEFSAMRRMVADTVSEAGPLDGILLALHGSMCAEDTGDCEGVLLEEIRRAAGHSCPLALTLDLHANLTTRMVSAADVIVAYRTYPHTDMYDTGLEAAALLGRVLRREFHPAMAMVKLPLIVPAENMQTSHGPFAEVWRVAAGCAAADPAIQSVSVFGVQPWLDIQEMGCAVLVVADRQLASAQSAATQVARRFWDLRNEFEVELLQPAEAIQRALAVQGGPVILAESSDSPTAGSPGDSAEMLEALLAHAPGQTAAVWLRDPGAVEQAWERRPGSDVDLTLGGAFDKVNRRPVRVRGRVRSLSDGVFRLKGQWNHGMRVEMGRTAVIEAGAVSVVVSQHSASMIDPELYRSQGIEPRDLKLVVVKSPNGFRVDYSPFAAAILLVDTPGISSANLRTLNYRRLPRPIHPLDATEWY